MWSYSVGTSFASVTLKSAAAVTSYTENIYSHGMWDLITQKHVVAFTIFFMVLVAIILAKAALGYSVSIIFIALRATAAVPFFNNATQGRFKIAAAQP